MNMQIEKRHRIFISHASADMWVAQQIGKCIEAVGADVFLDRRDIHAGDDFKKRIGDEIEKSDELVALFTPKSRRRSWVRHEMGIADAHKLRIICLFYGVTLQDFDGDEDGRGPLEDVSNIDINNFDEYLSQLRERISPLAANAVDPKFDRYWKEFVDGALETILERLDEQQTQISRVESWQSDYQKILPTG